MRSRTMDVFLIALCILVVPALEAVANETQEVELWTAQISERGRVRFEFDATSFAPSPDLEARVRFDQGQATVRIEYRNLKPAVLFGGDVTSYVLWAISREGQAHNLGELWVRETSGSLEVTTGLKEFALMVTGESYFLVDRPSAMVLYTSRRVDERGVLVSQVQFNDFAPAPVRKVETLERYAFSGEESLDLMQAEKALEIAERERCEEEAPSTMQEARRTLAQARGLAKEPRLRKDHLDYARRTVTLASEALRTTSRNRERRRIEEEIAERQRTLDALEQRAETARAEAEAAEAKRLEAEAKIGELAAERRVLMADRESLMSEKARLELERQNLQETSQALQGDVDRLGADLRSLSAERTTILAEKDELGQAVSALQEDKESLATSLAKLEQERQSLERQAAELEADKEAVEEERAKLASENERLSQEKKELESQTAQLAADKKAVEEDRAQLVTENERLSDDKASLEKRAGELAIEKASLEERGADLERQLAQVEVERERLEAEKEAIAGRLQGALSSVAETRKEARGYVVNLPDILFDFDKATLKPDAQLAVAKLSGILLMMPDLTLRIEGHTDSIGTKEYNQRLSEQRAGSVYGLLGTLGVTEKRMQTVGFGFDRPVADNSTDEGRAKNRRVEIIIAEGGVAEESSE